MKFADNKRSLFAIFRWLTNKDSTIRFKFAQFRIGDGRNTAIRYGSVTKFEFGYGFDGGRCWTKDIVGDKWTWYPCGVASSAGELVELTSNLAGTTWTTSSTNLTQGGCGSSLIRSGTQFVATDAYHQVSTLTDGTGTTVATAVFDRLGVQRSGTGALSAGVTRQVYGGGDEDGLAQFKQKRKLKPPHGQWRKPGPPVYIYPQWPLYDGRWNDGWGYGNYCGRHRNGVHTHPGGLPVPNMQPIDEIDGCCQDHDNNTKGMWEPISTRDADCKLYRCAKTKSCRGDALCEIAKADIMKFASVLCFRPFLF